MLRIAEALAARGREPQVELLHVFVAGEVRGRAVHDDPAVLEDVAVVRVPQRDVGVLLGQQETHFLLFIEAAHDLEYFLDDLRRESHGRLVQKNHGRPRHQRAPDGRHLLFPAGGVTRLALAPFLEAREILIDHFQVLSNRRAAGAAGESAGQEVFFHGQMLEAMSAFHYLHHAELHQFPGRGLVDALAAKFDRSLGHVATLRSQQVRNCLERRRLARAIGTEQRNDRPFLHLQRNALEHQDHVVVDDLDVVDGEEGRRICGHVVFEMLCCF